MDNKILKKEAGLFVENNIDSYRVPLTITFKEAMITFVSKGGFLIFKDDDGNFEGYIDIADADNLIVIAEDATNKNRKISELIKGGILKIRKRAVYHKDTLNSVITDLEDSGQEFFPVLDSKTEELIGRISKKIIFNKLNKIYGDIFN